MKVVLINHSDSRGGASVVSVRLMEALRSLGVDASMLVVHKSSSSPHIHVVDSSLARKIPFLAEHARIFAGNGFTRRHLFAASIATDGLSLSRHPLVRQADSVMLGWINQGMLSLDEIGRIAAMGKRIVWTMHDMWNLTGICHHAGECIRYKNTPGCGDCPLLHSRASAHDLSRTTWKRKKALYDSTNIRFVAVSSWLAEKCRESSLMANQNVTVIPNPFPVDNFYVDPKHSRAQMGLPEGKKLIVMGAARLDDPVKGLPYAVETFNKLAEAGRTDAHAVFFGNLRNPHALAELRMPYTFLGPISSTADIAEIYAHATAVLSSSLYETLPGTLVEGMAAGCWAVSFDRGGQADIITPGITGTLAPFGNTTILAKGLQTALDGKFDPMKQRQSVADRFSAHTIARRYLRLLEHS